MSKYIIAPYSFNSKAMYEEDDYRLNQYKINDVEVGEYKQDKTIKGEYNGYEIGIFITTKNKQYLVFIDHSVKER